MVLAASLRRNVQTRGKANALTDGAHAWSWIEYADHVARLAGGLAASGVSRGDRLALVMGNHADTFTLFHAALSLGAAIVPLNTRWSSDELAMALEDCRPALLISDHAFEDAVAPAAAQTGVHRIVRKDARGIAELAAHEPVAANDAEDGDLAAIFYTGGTTGRSKGVMLSHGNLTSNAFAMMAEGFYGGGERYLHASPLFHIAGAMGVFSTLISGASSVMLPRFDAGEVLAIIARERCTQTLLVPTMIQMTIDHPAFAQHDLSSLRRILYGASPISEAVLDRALKQLPHVALAQLYGMTETSPVATVLHASELSGQGRAKQRHRSAGRATFGVEIRIVDADDNSLPVREVGEISIRGPNVMMGYWDREPETAAALRGGWMHTGDGGYMDEEGFVYVVDRIKDMIITGGENVYSVEVENVLAQHPGVLQCAVIGIPHEKWGEQVHGVVVVRDGHSVEAGELEAWCRTKLAGFKAPRSFEVRREPLPISAAGKILKRELRAPYWSEQTRQVG